MNRSHILMNDSQKNFYVPVTSVQELLERLEAEQTIGWHGVSDPPPPPVQIPEWSIQLGKAIKLLQDLYAVHDYLVMEGKLKDDADVYK